MSDATSLSKLSPDASSEMPRLCALIEASLAAEFGADRFNYLALMMVDPHVHFHVIPRYGQEVRLAQDVFTDTAWPGPPDITSSIPLSDEQFAFLKDRLVRRMKSCELNSPQ